jgi:F-type H+-transporting ATPase subunit epsilon
MANTFSLKIVTPSHEVYNGEVEKVLLKSADGEFEILANHANLIASTVPSIVKFKDAEGKDNELFVSKALIQVGGNQVLISSDAAEFEEEIDEARAEEAMQRAEDRLKNPDRYNKHRAEAAMLRAKQRLMLKKSNNK